MKQNIALFFKILPPFLITLSLLNCADDSKKPEKSVRKETSTSSRNKSSSRSDTKSGFEISGQSKTLVYSLSHHSLSGYLLDQKELQDLGKQARARSSQSSANSAELRAAMAITATQSRFDDVLAISKRIMTRALKKNVDAKMTDSMHFDLALSAYTSKRYSLSLYYLEQISKKKSTYKAAAHNLTGMIYQRMSNLPEAITAWEQALNISPSYEPARLNIAFAALKYGDGTRAIKMLSKIKQTWFTKYGQMIAYRLLGQGKKAEYLCEQVLKDRPNYGPALISCALNQYQSLKNAKKSYELLNTVIKNKKNPAFINELAYKVLSKIKSTEKRLKTKQKSDSESNNPSKKEKKSSSPNK